MKEALDTLQKKVLELTSKVASLEADKVEQLQKVVKAMSRKAISLEGQVKEMKRKSLEGEGVKLPSFQEIVEEKEIVTEPDTPNKNCSINKSFSANIDKEVYTSTPTKEKVQKAIKKEHLFTCTRCSYRCKKEIFLNKHMVTKHEEHVKKNNRKEDLNVSNIEIQDSDEVKVIKRAKNMEAIDNGEKDKSFFFSESKFFDKFL